MAEVEGKEETLNTALLLKSLFKRNAQKDTKTLSALHSPDNIVRPATPQLAEFNRVIHWQHKDWLAPTWLQVRAFPTYLNLLSAPAFPFSPLGLVHVANQVQILKPLPATEQYQVCCALDNYQTHAKGVLFDISLTAKIADEVVYQGKATNLAITQKTVLKNKPSDASKPTAPCSQDTAATTALASWQLDNKIGREYARVSGDYNPIHLYPLSAKLFGFKRHIAHGMYLKARALSAILAEQVTLPSTASITFRKPVLLPSNLNLLTQRKETSSEFTIISNKGVHASGDIQY